MAGSRRGRRRLGRLTRLRDRRVPRPRRFGSGRRPGWVRSRRAGRRARRSGTSRCRRRWARRCERRRSRLGSGTGRVGCAAGTPGPVRGAWRWGWGFHSERSWSVRRTIDPWASTRLGRRASVSHINASTPVTSGSSGMSVASTRPMRIASVERSPRESARRLTGKDRSDDRSREQMDRDQRELARNVIAGYRGHQTGQCGERHRGLDEAAPWQRAAAIEDCDEQSAQQRPGERELGERRQRDPPPAARCAPAARMISAASVVAIAPAAATTIVVRLSDEAGAAAMAIDMAGSFRVTGGARCAASSPLRTTLVKSTTPTHLPVDWVSSAADPAALHAPPSTAQPGIRA